MVPGVGFPRASAGRRLTHVPRQIRKRRSSPSPSRCHGNVVRKARRHGPRLGMFRSRASHRHALRISGGLERSTRLRAPRAQLGAPCDGGARGHRAAGRLARATRLLADAGQSPVPGRAAREQVDHHRAQCRTVEQDLQVVRSGERATRLGPVRDRDEALDAARAPCSAQTRMSGVRSCCMGAFTDDFPVLAAAEARADGGPARRRVALLPIKNRARALREASGGVRRPPSMLPSDRRDQPCHRVAP